MEFDGQFCDRSLIENPVEFENYLSTSRKKIDKNLYIKYTINNISFDEIDKRLEDYMSTHNKKFVFFKLVANL